MTGKLYLTDSYLRECEAEVIKAEKIEGKNFVVLDRTVFYPQSGGQPSDTGKITVAGGAEYRVVFANNTGEDVLYEVDMEGLKAGDRVNCIVDWEKRYKLMRMHTSAHIMAAVVNREYGALITGNQLGERQTRMDFDCQRSRRKKYLRSRGRRMK